MKAAFALGSAASLLLALSGQAFAQAVASNHMVAMRYDKSRRVVGVVLPDPDGAGPIRFLATRNAYDAQGRLTKVETGELANWPGDAAPAAWGSFGFTIFRTVDNLHDASGRKIREAVSAGGAITSVVQASYNAAGQPVCVAVRMNPAVFGTLPADACTLSTQGAHGPDRITRTLYDVSGRVATVQKAYGTSLQHDYVSYTYTRNEKQATVTDANGAMARYVYDGLDRLSRWHLPSKISGGVSNDADYEEYTYDPVGNRTSLRKRDGQLIGYSYDALGRISVKDIPGTSISDVYYGYDNRGLQLFARFGSNTGEGVNDEYDGAGRQIKSTNTMSGANLIIQRAYDANGNRIQVTHPDANYFTYEYDGLDRLAVVRENGATGLAAPTYNARAERVSDERSVGAISYAYDALSRPTSATLSGTTANLTTGYSYNPASQLTLRTRSNSTYVYGEEQSLTRHYTVNGLNQYLTGGPASYEYDANGNFRSDGGILLTYDVENRLISSSGARVASLSYDPLGRLWQTVGAGNTTRFLYDGDELVAEYNSSGAMLKRYVHDAAEDDPIAMYDGPSVSASVRTQLFGDHQGSIIARVGSSGSTLVSRYDDWGIPDAGDQGRFQFTGQAWIPELRMYYYKARIYSPTLGRFLQIDPIGYQDQVNLYAYVANDPIGGRDPTGLARVCTTPTGSLVPSCVGVDGNGDGNVKDNDLTSAQKRSLSNSFGNFIADNRGANLSSRGKSVDGTATDEQKSMVRATSQFVGAALMREGGDAARAWAGIRSINAVTTFGSWFSHGPAYYDNQTRIITFTGRTLGGFWGNPYAVASPLARSMIHEALHPVSARGYRAHIEMDDRAIGILKRQGLDGEGCPASYGFNGC